MPLRCLFESTTSCVRSLETIRVESVLLMPRARGLGCTPMLVTRESAVTPEFTNQCLAFGTSDSPICPSDYDVSLAGQRKDCDRDLVQRSNRSRLVFAQVYSPIDGHSEMQELTCQ